MLTENEFVLIAKRAEQLYAGLELEIIEEIAERIANVGYANTVVHNDAMILQELGVLYQNVIKLVAKYNNETEEKIRTIFEEAGIKSISKDDMIYRYAGLNPVPLKRSRSLSQLLVAEMEKTHYNLSRLTMTTAQSSEIQFLNSMNKAYLEVSTGVKSYSQSIIDIVKGVSKKGTVVTYNTVLSNGQNLTRSLESAVRMNVVTSVNQTCGKLQELRADEMGWDLVEVSSHSGARPDHAEWQGKVYSLKGLTKGYKTLEEACDYGKVTGLCGVNCRHTFFPYYRGSTKTYTSEELAEMKKETVTYNGQKIKKYDATQMQRSMERKIRQNKKDIAGLQGILTSDNKNIDIEQTQKELKEQRAKLKENKNQLNNFLEQTGFRIDNSRLVI